jgi:hypothetical protein
MRAFFVILPPYADYVRRPKCVDVALQKSKQLTEESRVCFVHPVEIKYVENFHHHPWCVASNHSFGNQLLCFGNELVQMLHGHEQKQMAQTYGQQTELFGILHGLEIIFHLDDNQMELK